jgi:hypothetical protein
MRVHSVRIARLGPLPVRGAALLAWVGALAACAGISGLDAYSAEGNFEGTCTGSCAADGGGPADDGALSTDMTETGGPPTEPDDASEGASVESSDSTTAAGARPDAAVEGVESAAPGIPPDATPESAACNAQSCAGCCTAAGLCAAGGLDDACGTAGAACSDCSTSGLACTAGACGAAPEDSGAQQSQCNPSQCANLCVPYFVQCCKSDETCGCALLFPMGSCN